MPQVVNADVTGLTADGAVDTAAAGMTEEKSKQGAGQERDRKT